MSLKLNVIIGSTRPGRNGPIVGEWVRQAAVEHAGFAVELVDLAAFDLPLLDEPAHPRLQTYIHDHTKRWSQSVASGDAFVFVTPEYDHFPPASLVNAIQVLQREWGYKPAGIVSYGGLAAGARSAYVLRNLLNSLNVHVIPHAVLAPMYSQLIGEDRTFRPTPVMAQGAAAMFEELRRWAEALRTLRA